MKPWSTDARARAKLIFYLYDTNKPSAYTYFLTTLWPIFLDYYNYDLLSFRSKSGKNVLVCYITAIRTISLKVAGNQVCYQKMKKKQLQKSFRRNA